MRIYQLFHAPEKLRYVRFDFDHNYNQTSREAVYQWFDRWLLHQPDQPVPEVPFHKEPDPDLRVFPDGKLPPDAISQAGLVQYLINTRRERLLALDPVNKRSLANYRRIMQPAWQRTLQLDWPPPPVRTTVKFLVQRANYITDQLEITRPGEEETINVARFSPLKARPARKPVVIVLTHPDGAAHYLDDSGAPRGLAGRLLERGFAVAIAVHSGGAAVPQQSSLFFTTYNRTRLQKRVRDLVSICQAVKDISSNNCRVALCGSGSAAFWSLLAAPAADAVIADCGQADVSDDNTLLAPDLFCPGIRNIDTFEGALVLAAPRPLLLHNAAAAFPATRMRSCYKTLRAGNNFRLESRCLDDDAIVAWIAALRF
jgi:hypothetical protein